MEVINFGLDLVSFVEQRGPPQYFRTQTAHVLWPASTGHIETWVG